MRTRLLAVVLLLLALAPAWAQDAPPANGFARSPEVQRALEAIPVDAVRSEIAEHLTSLRGRLSSVRESASAARAKRDGLERVLAEEVEKALERFRNEYATDDPPSTEEVRRKLQALQLQIANAAENAPVEFPPGNVEDLQTAIDLVQTAQRDLHVLHDDWRSRVSEAVGEDISSGLEREWAVLRRRHAELLQEVYDTLSREQTDYTECLTLVRRIADGREETIALLRRENLLLRGRSEITVDALRQGVRDIGELPDWFARTGRAALTAVRSGDHTADLLRWLATSLLVMALLAFGRRRLQKRLREPEDLSTDVQRSLDLGLRLLGSILWGGLLAAPFLLAPSALEGLPHAWGNVARVVGYAVGGFWIVRGFARRLLPGTGRWSPVDMDPRSAMLVRTGVMALAWLSVLFVPIAFALVVHGYENLGARQAVWTLYKLLAVVVLLLFVLRRGVLLGFLPAKTTRLGGVLRRAVGVVHPVLVLVGPLLLALDFLEYDVLAEFLLRLVGGVLIAGAAGFLVFGTVWRGLSAWISSVVAEPPDATPETSRVDAALKVGRYVLLLGVLFGAISLMLGVQGGDLAAVQDILDVELPFQGQIEGKHITWFDVVAGLAVILLFLTAVPKLKLALERFVLPRTSLDSGLRYTISTLVGYVFAAIGIYVGLIQIFDLGAIGYVFAALSVGIGFGLQEIVSNFVSGLILLFERPIKVGDLITVGDTEGWVTKINIRATTIQTRDNVSMLIPNKDFITQPVVNSVYGDTILRVRVNVGVAYGSDTQLVQELMLQAAKEHPVVLTSRRTEVNFRDFGGSSLDFSLLCWIPEAAEHMRVASDLRFKIDQLFRENGVEIPFSQHDLHLRSIDDGAAAQLWGERTSPPGEAREAEPEPPDGDAGDDAGDESAPEDADDAQAR